jgi:hypothetical protein
MLRLLVAIAFASLLSLPLIAKAEGVDCWQVGDLAGTIHDVRYTGKDKDAVLATYHSKIDHKGVLNMVDLMVEAAWGLPRLSDERERDKQKQWFVRGWIELCLDNT